MMTKKKLLLVFYLVRCFLYLATVVIKLTNTPSESKFFQLLGSKSSYGFSQYDVTRKQKRNTTLWQLQELASITLFGGYFEITRDPRNGFIKSKTLPILKTIRRS